MNDVHCTIKMNGVMIRLFRQYRISKIFNEITHFTRFLAKQELYTFGSRSQLINYTA